MDFTEIRLSGKTRREHDLLGEMEIPAEYYFGVQTMRAVENFHISRVGCPRPQPGVPPGEPHR